MRWERVIGRLHPGEHTGHAVACLDAKAIVRPGFHGKEDGVLTGDQWRTVVGVKRGAAVLGSEIDRRLPVDLIQRLRGDR
jgi:hypothetical protein